MNHIDEKVSARSAGAKGDGLYATQPIRAGETVVAFGGYAIDRVTLDDLPADRRMHAIQIDDDLFLVGPHPAEPGDLVNHSCDPNCGLVGAVLVVAMRDIEPGEEITFDYAMCDSADYDEFDCSCDTPHLPQARDRQRLDAPRPAAALRRMVLVVPGPQDRGAARRRRCPPRVRSLTA